jgi:hypothetical protein
MSEKLKKQTSSIPFSIGKLFTRISEMRPSTLLISAVVIGGAILLFSGLIYDIVNTPLPAVYYNSRFYFLYPQLSEQFVFDTVVAGILYAVGFIGLLVIYQSSRHAYSQRNAYMNMIVGATLLFIAYLFLEYFIQLKLSGG